MTTAPLGFISINDAAAALSTPGAEVKPQDVVRLADSGQLRSLYLISEASVRKHKQQQESA